MKILKFLTFLIMVLLPATLLSQKIILTPQWTAQSQFAGYYVALEKGFYEEAGLEVEIQHPSVSYPAINRLIEGSSNVITMQLMQAIIEVDKGTQLVNILQTSQHNGLLVVSRNEKLESIKDLKGKKVGIWQVGFGEMALMIDKEHQIGIEWVPFIQNVNLFISGAVDATLAMSYNEYLSIYSAGFENNPVIRFSEVGYDFPEDGLYVTRDYYNRFPEKMDAFAQASRRGWEWAHENPKETLEIVMKMAERTNVPTSKIHQEWMLNEVLSLQKVGEDGELPFTISPESFKEISGKMFKNGMISREILIEEIERSKR